jgi:RHS repeat-associated protein
MAIARSSEVSLTHAYNSLDERTSTTTTISGNPDTRNYLYAPDGRVIGEYGSSAADVRAEFIWMNPEAANDNGSPFGGDDGLDGYMPLAVAVPAITPGVSDLLWVHANHMSVPAVFTNASGATIAMPTTYSAPGFPGQSRTLADLYYNKYRDYDPTTGRYIQADPIGLAGGTNPYSYAMNSPLRYRDPTGEIVPLIIGFLIWFDIDLIEQRLGGSRAWQPWNNEYCIEQDIDFGQAALAGALGAIPTAKIFKWWKYGKEFRIGKVRLAPFGNRNPKWPRPHPRGRWPHWHVDKGPAPTYKPWDKRHRPWDTKSNDTSFWDRFF